MKSHFGRRAFTHMELYSLFNGYIYGDEKLKREQPKHWHFWLPLLAYYTGAYSDELGNLTLTDIKKIELTHTFNFATNGKIQPRFVPIHTALWHAGLEDYIQYVKNQGHERLLFDLPSKSGRYSEKVRIWFSGEGKRLGYLQRCGLPNVDQQGLKTAISSLRLNFEQQVYISAIQSGQRSAMSYLLGLKEDGQVVSKPAYDTLQKVIMPLRVINTKVSWQRFLERH
ncbi:hypothetical protein N474_12610 [Pseudoalteromonas luteoviolacea CPMOR-2]|uniref:Uncharacterized protein n=1 Tax=Pseudoalteromonas luteoviolacea DSM 6061 TaxID=1365250 RepID=A0A167CDX2_9GAMM|nr:hypothetical protein [Pseudoalteromonas luteoviolacea]KZN47547.1 hypothetical protein N475_06615 [Pseudoalteromonas luteoviolacea DSM 6061]KZN56115.1 hypothetical protein N474_12610 [Pseudoalteromonas luteoviolacea CPMOR-2]MBE0388556.1 hypothetical protein [Pseudoalteromonas luteoviolacea DSM 6061]